MMSNFSHQVALYIRRRERSPRALLLPPSPTRICLAIPVLPIFPTNLRTRTLGRSADQFHLSPPFSFPSRINSKISDVDTELSDDGWLSSRTTSCPGAHMLTELKALTNHMETSPRDRMSYWIRQLPERREWNKPLALLESSHPVKNEPRRGVDCVVEELVWHSRCNRPGIKVVGGERRAIQSSGLS
jgi:hypothetical protein